MHTTSSPTLRPSSLTASAVTRLTNRCGPAMTSTTAATRVQLDPCDDAREPVARRLGPRWGGPRSIARRSSRSRDTSAMATRRWPPAERSIPDTALGVHRRSVSMDTRSIYWPPGAARRLAPRMGVLSSIPRKSSRIWPKYLRVADASGTRDTRRPPRRLGTERPAPRPRSSVERPGERHQGVVEDRLKRCKGVQCAARAARQVDDEAPPATLRHARLSTHRGGSSAL